MEISYSSSYSTESVTIDGEARAVKTFAAAPTMTVTVSGINDYFDRNRSKITLKDASTDTEVTSWSGEYTWTQPDGPTSGKWKASCTIAKDGRFKVEVSPNGVLTQTEYIDVDLLGPQVEVTFNKVGANPDGETNYFKEWTSATVTVRDRHFNTSSVTPRVISPSGKPDTFFGSWVSQGTDSNGNVVYTSTSSYFEESAFEETYKFSVTAKDTAGHETAYAYGDNAAADTTTGAGAKSTKDSAGTELKGTNGFVVDTTRPTVAVKLGDLEVFKAVDDDDDDDNKIDYFKGVNQDGMVLTATIVVTDRNFNASGTAATMKIKPNGTSITPSNWEQGTESGHINEWTCTIGFPQSKPGEKYSFSFTATDWAGLTTEYHYGDNEEKTDDAGARSTVDSAEKHEKDEANKLNGKYFVIDYSHPNVNVTMGGARVYTDDTNKVDGFNVNTVTVAVKDASFDATATSTPQFTQPSGASGIEFSGWDSDTMTITLPDSKKSESYKFTLTAKDMIGGQTTYNYGENNGEETDTRVGNIGRARSTKDSIGATMTGSSFIIDTTAPKLSVSFDTAAVNTAGEKTELTRYYNGDTSSVVAKISVTDIHLNTNDISVKVYESDGTTEATGCYTVSSWADGADDTRVATVTINKPATDQTYILKITGKDQFANQIESADPDTTYVEPAAGTADAYYQSKIAFDTQAPKIAVSWGDEATNGKYYNTDRKATITVTETSFDASRFQISQDGGSTWTTTAASDWEGSGTHTYTGSLKDFTSNGTFRLQVKGTDLVGNVLVAGDDPVDDGKPVATQQGSISGGTYSSAEFVINRTTPSPDPRPTPEPDPSPDPDPDPDDPDDPGDPDDDPDDPEDPDDDPDDSDDPADPDDHDSPDDHEQPDDPEKSNVPEKPAINRHNGTNHKASGTAGGQLPRTGDTLFGLNLPLTAGCLSALLVAFAALLRRRAKSHA